MLFTLEWLQKPGLRQRVRIGLKQGEGRNTPARAVLFHRRESVRDRLREDLRLRGEPFLERTFLPMAGDRGGLSHAAEAGSRGLGVCWATRRWRRVCGGV